MLIIKVLHRFREIFGGESNFAALNAALSSSDRLSSGYVTFMRIMILTLRTWG